MFIVFGLILAVIAGIFLFQTKPIPMTTVDFNLTTCADMKCYDIDKVCKEIEGCDCLEVDYNMPDTYYLTKSNCEEILTEVEEEMDLNQTKQDEDCNTRCIELGFEDGGRCSHHTSLDDKFTKFNEEEKGASGDCRVPFGSTGEGRECACKLKIYEVPAVIIGGIVLLALIGLALFMRKGGRK